MRLLPSYELSAHMSSSIAPLRPWAMLEFDPEKWRPLCAATASQLGCELHELSLLHEIDAARGITKRKNRRRTTGARLDVDALQDMVRAYEQFVCEVVAPHVAESFIGPCDEVVFQAVPSLRVAVPSSKAAGQRHRDGAYGHQPGQINFWLPLAPAHGNNTLWLEPPSSADDAEDVGAGRQHLQSPDAWPLEGSFGTLHRFHGHACFHFTKPNDTPTTRVSLDFRVIPGPCYDDDWSGSRNQETGVQCFFIGGYYAKAAFDGRRWAVRRETKPGGGFLRSNAAKHARGVAADAERGGEALRDYTQGTPTGESVPAERIQ